MASGELDGGVGRGSLPRLLASQRSIREIIVLTYSQESNAIANAAKKQRNDERIAIHTQPHYPLPAAFPPLPATVGPTVGRLSARRSMPLIKGPVPRRGGCP